MDDHATDPIIIVGAGPTGLTLALSLGLAGVPVLLLEAEPGLHEESRGAAYHPPTLEIFARLGIVDEMRRLGIAAPIWQIWDLVDGLVAAFDLGLLADRTPFPYRLHLEQGRLARLLLDRIVAAAPSVTVRFGAAVVDVGQAEGHAWVALAGGERIAAPFVIGCEGARSVVRQSAGIEFEGFTWPERFLVSVLALDLAPHGFANAGYIADPERWAAFFHLPGDGPPGVWRVVYPVPAAVEDGDALDPAAVQASLRGILGAMGVAPPGGVYPLAATSIYRVHQRVATRFAQGRLILAGDAAHLNNPLGGFGLNGGVQDAASLAEKLVQILRDRSPHGPLLDRYDRQRRPFNIKAVQALSIRNKRLLEESDPAVRRERQVELRATAADPVLARAYLLNTSMINAVEEAAAVA
ncbi:MAG: NAD(P)/FAD-dependent oxidoreductase [Pseudomonadota bacterium]